MRIRRLRESISHHSPANPVSGIKVKSMLPVEGEWFCLQIAYEAQQPPRMFLSRVVLWALVEGAYTVDHVVGIDAIGTPHQDPFSDFHYLCGADIAPNGSAWSDVYRSAEPSFYPVREVTHLFEGQA
ncbi:MAG: hypothetical protein JWN14_2009 [Chthonomonadales bacterium]|nr:hypothetical protein [Chthonomonadales bacterium]